MRCDALVVGGGLAGLASAVALSRNGLRVVLVEKNDQLGGRARSCTDPVTGDVVDVGPHVLLTEYPNLLGLLELLGTRERIHWDDGKVLTVVERGQAVPLRSSRLPAPFHLLPSLLRVPGLSVGDLLSNHRASWFAIRAGEHDLLELDDLDALTFLQRMKASPRLIDWFWATVAMAILNVPLEQCSAAALLRFYRILISHPDLHLGFPRAGLSELYAPQSVRLIESSGGRVLTGRRVDTLSLDGGAVSGAVLADGRRIASDVCICAVEPGAVSPLLPACAAASGPPFTNLSWFRPSPYISTYLWFDRKLTTASNWARAWSPQNLNYDFYDLSNIRPDWLPRPSVIAGNIIYSYRAEAMSDDEIVEATAREIAEFTPRATQANIRHARVHRLPMAIPCPHPGVERRRPGPRTPVRGLFLAGDWTDTGLPCSMESAVRSGSLAAEAVLSAAGRGVKLAREVAITRGLVRLIPARRGRTPWLANC